MTYTKDVLAQLSHPSGESGKLILKHLNEVNSNINQVIFDALAISDGECILEIGFGGGGLISKIFREYSDVKVYGMEISQTAVDYANKIFYRECAAQRAKFVLVNPDFYYLNSNYFDKIAAVNVIYFLPDIKTEFCEAFQLLKPSGRFVLGYAQKSPDGINEFPAELVESALHKAGFNNLTSTSSHDDENGEFYCTTARKPE